MRKSDSEDVDLDAVMKDVAALKTAVGTLMEHVKDNAADAVNGHARHIYGVLAAEGERSVATIAQRVEERPFASLLIAFAVGFLGSRILAR
jgi:ElaB/YqjD/DUF883 family membrane-anchored ribosome-binding protein